MIDITPDPIAFTIGSFPIHWYGICYAVGLAAVYLLLVREARRRGQDPEIVGNGMVIVAIAALIGGRLYHVIDQWAIYAADPITALLPITRQVDGSYAFAGFSGLGVPGGIITGTLAAWYLTRRWKVDFGTWADIVAPGLFVMQSIGRIGNFFNQELYGPPTSLPWGIAIDCLYRVPDYPCASFPSATTHFHPLFLYESLSGLIGAAVLLWLARRHSSRLRSGDLLLIFLVWYGTTRFFLEFMRTGNWTFFGIPTAQIVSAGFVAVGLGMLLYRHRRGGGPAPTDADLDAAEPAAAEPAAAEPAAAEPDVGEPDSPTA